MRTKTLLIVAALSAAGIATSSAQAVYSVNAVGFVNVVMPRGLSIIANPLNAQTNRVASLFVNPPNGFTVFKFNGTSFSINAAEAPPGGGAPEFGDPDQLLSPGEGAFVLVPGPVGTPSYTNTFVGEVPQAAASNLSVPAGLRLISSVVPQEGLLQTVLGYPAAAGDRVFRYVNSTGSYLISAFEAPPGGLPPEWDDQPVIKVGEGFYTSTAAAKTWNRNFSVN